MKTKSIIFIALIFLCSCSKEKNIKPTSNLAANELLSEWILIETYLDPGDGSGDYMPYNGDEKNIKFYDNGTITSNLSLCHMLSNNSEGIFYSDYDAEQIVPQACNLDFDYYITYDINDNEMILSYLCFEGCLEKYERIY